MKKYILPLSLIFITSIFTGCGVDEPKNTAKLTQEIREETILKNPTQNNSIELVAQNNLSNTNENNLQSEDKIYYDAEAQKDALDIEIDSLEAKHRIGEITTDEFISLKTQLELEKSKFEIIEDTYKNTSKLTTSIPDLSNLTVEELYKMKLDIESQENAIDIEEDTLEFDYRNGKITKDEYLKKQKELIERENMLDIQDDAIERRLEMLGYDD